MTALPTDLVCIRVTPGAKALFARDSQAVLAAFGRFLLGDLGLQGHAPGVGGERHGTYPVQGEALQIDYDGAVTTVCLPEEG